MNARAIFLTVLDALEDGDARYAVDVLLSALEDVDSMDAPAVSSSTAHGRLRYRCDRCGHRCQWPGELHDHRFRVHGVTS